MKEILFILVFLWHLGYVPGVCWNCLRLVEDIILYESNLHYTSEGRNFGEILSLNWCYISPLTNKHLQPTECLQPTLKCTFFGEFLGKRNKHFPPKSEEVTLFTLSFCFFFELTSLKVKILGPLQVGKSSEPSTSIIFGGSKMLISIACSGYKPSRGHPFFAHAANWGILIPWKTAERETDVPGCSCSRKNCFHPKVLKLFEPLDIWGGVHKHFQLFLT